MFFETKSLPAQDTVLPSLKILSLINPSSLIKIYVGPTLRSWLHETSALIMTLSPELKKNYTSERSYNSFPGTTCMSGFLENCQKSIPKSWCSPIQGTVSNFLFNYGTDLSPCFYTFEDLVSWIGEHCIFGMCFWQFSRHSDILVIPGKLLELRSNV